MKPTPHPFVSDRRYLRPRITTFAVTLAVGQIGEVIPAATATLLLCLD